MKILNQTKAYIALTLALGLGVVSCTKVSPLDVDNEAQAELLKRDTKKWAEEEETLAKNRADSARQAEENARLRLAYLEDLRAYKKTEHPVMFGWFAYWNPASPDKTFSLDHLPDSVDFVSNWGQQWNLDAARLEQWERLREKGTRMTAGFIIEGVGNGLQNAPQGGWSNDPYTAIEQYARALADSIAKYNYDGIDVDYEPQFRSPFKNGNHCGDPQNWTVGMADWHLTRPIISCQQTSNKDYENFFFTKLREFIPAEKMVNINGSIGWIDPSVYDKFNYFVFQSYNGTAGSWTGTAQSVIRRDSRIKPSQFIYTESFQSNKANADAFGTRYLPLVKQQRYGGIGAFHINEDYLYSEYKNIRDAITSMNPPMNN